MAERAATIEGIESIAVSMTERVIAEVIAHLSSKIDRAIADMEGRIEDRHAAQDARIDTRIAELAATVRVAAATVTEMVAGLSPSPSPPPRPGVIDAACKAAAEDGPQRITVDVYSRLVTHHVQPGDDPEQLWAEMCTAVISGAATWGD